MLTCYKLIPTGLSNKENNWSVRLAVTAIKENIPCAEPNATIHGTTKICQMERVSKESETASQLDNGVQ